MKNPLRRFPSYRLYVRIFPWMAVFYIAMFYAGFCAAILTRSAMRLADHLGDFGFGELLLLLFN